MCRRGGGGGRESVWNFRQYCSLDWTSINMYMYVQLVFLWKSVALPCCLFDLACFFLPSFLLISHYHVYITLLSLCVHTYIRCVHL